MDVRACVYVRVYVVFYLKMTYWSKRIVSNHLIYIYIYIFIYLFIVIKSCWQLEVSCVLIV